MRGAIGSSGLEPVLKKSGNFAGGGTGRMSATSTGKTKGGVAMDRVPGRCRVGERSWGVLGLGKREPCTSRSGRSR